MLKLLAFILLGVLFLRSIAYLFRLLIGGTISSRETNFGPNQSRRPRDGNLNIDHVPPDKKKNKDYDGGEYVDYEEVD